MRIRARVAWTVAALLMGGCDGLLGVSEPIIPDASDAAADHAAAARPKDAGHDARDANVVDPARDARYDTTVSALLDGATASDVVDGPRAPFEAEANDAPSEALSDGAHDATRDVAHDATPEASAPTTACPTGPGEPISCLSSAPGLTTCGAAGDDCCCASLEVEGGTFYRNYPNSAAQNPQSDPATVSNFRLDKYEVTVGRFRQYIQFLTSFAGSPPESGSGKHNHLNGGRGLVNVGATPPDGGVDAGPDGGYVGYEIGWDGADWDSDLPSGTSSVATWNAKLTTQCTGATAATWTAAAGPNENLPLNCVDWYDAYAFCIWDGGFLPSEAEWEYATAGGSQQRNYAWGSVSPGTGSQYAIYGCNYPFGNGICFDGGSPQNLAPVGTTVLGAGRWGQFDLAGNVAEWNLDSYFDYVEPCVDCVNLAGGQFRLQRGGSFRDTPAVLTPPGRFYGFSSAFFETGLRCARPP